MIDPKFKLEEPDRYGRFSHCCNGFGYGGVLRMALPRFEPREWVAAGETVRLDAENAQKDMHRRVSLPGPQPLRASLDMTRRFARVTYSGY